MSPSFVVSVITSSFVYDNPSLEDVTLSTFSTRPSAVNIFDPPSTSLISIPVIVIYPSESMTALAPSAP